MVQLQLTDKQAKIAARACEFYARIVLGQFREIIIELSNSDNIDNILKHRDEIEMLLFEARDLIYPELHGIGHSYGVGAFEYADRAYDIYQAIRKLFGDPRDSFSYHQLPEATHYFQENEAELDKKLKI
jgi:hypothetical protein